MEGLHICHPAVLSPPDIPPLLLFPAPCKALASVCPPGGQQDSALKRQALNKQSFRMLTPVPSRSKQGPHTPHTRSPALLESLEKSVSFEQKDRPLQAQLGVLAGSASQSGNAGRRKCSSGPECTGEAKNASLGSSPRLLPSQR